MVFLNHQNIDTGEEHGQGNEGFYKNAWQAHTGDTGSDERHRMRQGKGTAQSRLLLFGC